MKIYKKKIPIYYDTLMVVFSNDFNEVNERLKLGFNCDLSGYAGLAAKPKKNRYLIILSPKTSHSVIAHEITHICNMIFKDREIHLDISNDEPQAYLIGWLTTQVYIAVNKFKAKVVI